MREPLAGAAHAALHFVEHQQPAVLVADAAHFLQVAHGRRPDPAFALDHLEEHGDDVRVGAFFGARDDGDGANGLIHQYRGDDNRDW